VNLPPGILKSVLAALQTHVNSAVTFERSSRFYELPKIPAISKVKARLPCPEVDALPPLPERLPHRSKPWPNAIPVKAPRKQFEVRPAHTFKSDIAA